MHLPHANSHIAANMLAAAERHAADIARAERLRQLLAYQEEAIRSRRFSGLAEVRNAIGLALIRAEAAVRGGTAPGELAQAR